MLILQDAFQAALELLADLMADTNPRVDIVIMSCTEIEDGWLFGFDSREYAEGKISTKSIIGSGPIMVPRSGNPPFYTSVFDDFATPPSSASEHNVVGGYDDC